MDDRTIDINQKCPRQTECAVTMLNDQCNVVFMYSVVVFGVLCFTNLNFVKCVFRIIDFI